MQAVNARHSAARICPARGAGKKVAGKFLSGLTDTAAGSDRCRAMAAKEKAVVSSRAAHAVPELQADETREVRCKRYCAVCEMSRLRQVAGMQDGRWCAVAEREDKKLH